MIMKDSKLILEFMGIESINDKMRGHLYECPVTAEYVTELEYHTSWDWLMPVVSKCREESNAEDSHWEAVYYSLEGCDIDITYKAVLEFIEDYNKYICGSCGAKCNRIG